MRSQAILSTRKPHSTICSVRPPPHPPTRLPHQHPYRARGFNPDVPGFRADRSWTAFISAPMKFLYNPGNRSRDGVEVFHGLEDKSMIMPEHCKIQIKRLAYRNFGSSFEMTIFEYRYEAILLKIWLWSRLCIPCVWSYVLWINDSIRQLNRKFLLSKRILAADSLQKILFIDVWFWCRLYDSVYIQVIII